MKDQYFGDVNDFRKYGLLRALNDANELKPGVCWMLTEPDGRTDGRFLGYLARPGKYRAHDPELFDWLRTVIESGAARQVRQIEKSRLLGRAVFHSSILTDRLSARRAYFSECIAAFQGCDLVFFDPDNGLEVRSRPPGRRHSAKHLCWDEVSQAFGTGSSVLIYQHFIRENREKFSSRIAAELGRRTGAAAVFSFRTPHVMFVLASQDRHASLFRSKLERIGKVWDRQIIAAEHPITDRTMDS